MSLGEMVNQARGEKDVAEEELLEGLNPEQREACIHEEGPSLVVAVAGAGKTRVLVHRMARLVKVNGVHPARVLAVTFSKKGADEMNERLTGLIGKTDARVGTFHSLALEIHRMERIGCDSDEWGWTVDDRNKYRYCIKDAVGFKGMDWKKADVTAIESYISACKCDMARPGSDTAQKIAEAIYRAKPIQAHNPRMMHRAYTQAEDLRVDRGLLTFDDMLLDSVELLRDSESVRQRWAAKYDYVLQDEAQDQNLCQLLMGELLAKDHRNYMLVGDPAQCIYTWRGARPEKLLSFEQRWDAKVVKMGRNYRCGKTIIETANKSLRTMDPNTRLDVEMICEKDEEGIITSSSYRSLEDEGEAVATRIQSLVEDGHQPRHMVILYRTNAQSRAPEEALIGKRIPYRIIGGANFYERREVKNLLAYLRLADGRGDIEDAARCINAPFRYLGRAYVDRVRHAAEREKKHCKKTGEQFSWIAVIEDVNSQARVQNRQKASAMEWARMIEDIAERVRRAVDTPDDMVRKIGEEDVTAADDGKPSTILNQLVMETRYTEWLTREEGEESTENSRVSNVREMVRAAGRFMGVAELLDYVDKTIRASKKERKEKDPNKVTLCSIHRSKGMEWPIVALIGCAESILPHGRAEDPEEERRLFYVASTRAKSELHYSYAREVAVKNKVVSVGPSSFLGEVEHLPKEDQPGDASGFDDPGNV